MDEDTYRKIDSEAKAEARQAAEFAEQSPYPEISEITDDVYFEVDKKTTAGSQGRHFFHD